MDIRGHRLEHDADVRGSERGIPSAGDGGNGWRLSLRWQHESLCGGVQCERMRRKRCVGLSEQSSRSAGECEGAVWSADRGSRRSVPRVRSVCLRRCDDDRYGYSGCVEGAIEDHLGEGRRWQTERRGNDSSSNRRRWR